MIAGKYDIVINKRATFKLSLVLRNSSGTLINLTGYTAKMQIRKDPDGVVIQELTNLSGLTLGGTAGTILIRIESTATALYDFEFARYDLFITTGSESTKILEGDVKLDDSITQ